MEFAEHRLWMDSVGGHDKRRPHLRNVRGVGIHGVGGDVRPRCGVPRAL